MQALIHLSELRLIIDEVLYAVYALHTRVQRFEIF
jgi:hypothetical protein